MKIYDNKIDVSFIGTGHSDRAYIIEAIKRQCSELHLNSFFYLYLQSPLIYWFTKLTNRYFKRIKKSYFHYTPIKYDEYMKIMESSNAIIDIEHPKQKGLTIRTFEVLGNGKKLITTNAGIKNYDFYNDANIFILNREKPVLDKNFINKVNQALPDDLYYKYSIDGWLEDIFA